MWIAACALVFFAQGAIASNVDESEGPISLFLSYKCSAQHRAEFRTHMENIGIAEFEEWKKQGVFGDYLVLISLFASNDEAASDMLIRLDFEAFADVGKWKEIERNRPAGLSAAGLALCKPQDSHLARLSAHGAAERRDSSKSLFLRIPLYFKVPEEEYLKYFHAYVKPQYDGWIEEGTFASYGAYLNYLTQGSVWDMVFLYEYRDLSSFAQRYSVREKVRGRLRQDPNWAALHEGKYDVRAWGRALPMEQLLPATR